MSEATRAIALRLMTERDSALGVIERLRIELSGRVAEVDALRTRNSNLEGAITAVRALCEDEWGSLADDSERCVLCRHKWTKHGDSEETHYATSHTVAAVVRLFRNAINEEAS